jgi:hypothetical protein
MRSAWTLAGALRVQKAGADNITFKLMLVKSSYVFDYGHAHISDLAEIAATNYVGGYGGAGRKTVALGLTAGPASLRVLFRFAADVVWSALGGATNDTVGAIALVEEVGGSDATANYIAFLDLSDFTTSGDDFTFLHDAIADLWTSVF